MTYGICAESLGVVKIGKTLRSVSDRMLELQTAMPCELEVIAMHDDDVERATHDCLRDLRLHLRGEWFWLRDETVRSLRDLGFRLHPSIDSMTYAGNHHGSR